MALFSRFGEALTANLHSFLDKFEDPVKVAKLLVREMEAGYEKAKLALAHQMTAERRLKDERGQAQRFADAWSSRAAGALRDGDEALARESLRHRIEQLDAAERLDELLADERRITESLRSDMGKIEEKLAEMRRQRDALAARQGIRKVSKKVDQLTESAGRPSGGADRLSEASDRLSLMSEESRALAEIEGSAVDEVEAAFREEELKRRVEESLAALKSKVERRDSDSEREA